MRWGDPADPGTRIESTAGHHFAHAPTVAWAPQAGNPQGQLLAIGQLLLNNTDNAVAPDNGRVYMTNAQSGQGPGPKCPPPCPCPTPRTTPAPTTARSCYPPRTASRCSK
ncbi:MAG: hypothetical protein WKG07_16600 [Hymenobacter sp.]